MNLSAEACSPANVERLLEQIQRGEEALLAAKTAHTVDFDRIREAVGAQNVGSEMLYNRLEGDPLKRLLDLLGEMNRVYRLQPPSDTTELDRLRTNLKSTDGAMRTYGDRAQAYSGFVDQVMALARQRDLELVWIKGAQLLAFYDELLKNPSV